MNKSTALWLAAMCCPARCRLKHWNACRISTVPVQLIYGNGEVAVLEQLAGRDPAAVPEPYRLTIRWTAEQLGPEQQRFLAAWPKTRCRNLPGDRKSTRLNSSHGYNSYAVFCLKQKT